MVIRNNSFLLSNPSTNDWKIELWQKISLFIWHVDNLEETVIMKKRDNVNLFQVLC